MFEQIMRIVAVVVLVLTCFLVLGDFWRIDKPRSSPFTASGFAWNMLYYVPAATLACYVIFYD